MMECTDSLDEFSKLHTVLCYNLQWFAQDGEGGEKTEPATEKKLKDAREEGKVAKSKELIITIAKNAATTRYSHILLPRNRDITNIKVPISLTLGSSLCITESA